MKVDVKTKKTGDKEIRYTHIQNESETICFMFSGAGYSYDRPLFYYATMAMLEEKDDEIVKKETIQLLQISSENPHIHNY